MTKLEKASHISVILVCALTAYVLLRPHLGGPVAGAPHGESPMLGKTLDLADAEWSGRLNLVVAMTTKCRFCEASVPFYQRLNRAVRDAGSGVTLQMASSEPVGTTKTFLAERQLEIPRVLSAPFKSMGVTGTPTLIVVDRKGIVKQVYLGKLNQAQEDEVLALVRPVSNGAGEQVPK